MHQSLFLWFNLQCENWCELSHIMNIWDTISMGWSSNLISQVEHSLCKPCVKTDLCTFMFCLCKILGSENYYEFIFIKAVSVSFAYVVGMGIMAFSAIMNDKKVTIWHFYDLFSKLWPFCDFSAIMNDKKVTIQQLWTTLWTTKRVTILWTTKRVTIFDNRKCCHIKFSFRKWNLEI